MSQVRYNFIAMKDIETITNDLANNFIKELTDGLYGPKHCKHCNKIQPIIVYKLDGSDYTKSEGMVVTVGYTGSQVCSICYKTIETEG